MYVNKKERTSDARRQYSLGESFLGYQSVDGKDGYQSIARILSTWSFLCDYCGALPP